MPIASCEAYGIYACNEILFNHESPIRGETFVTRKITCAPDWIGRFVSPQSSLLLSVNNSFVQYPSIKSFDPDLWDHKAAELVHHQVESVVRRRGQCNILLTGGSAAKRMYAAWSRECDIFSLKNISFYFGDERCVLPDRPESNYGMAMNTLFKSGMPQGCAMHRMEAESDDLEAAAERYAAILPRAIDILLLGVGEDGHIASLFPFSAALHENRRWVLPIIGPKRPNRRLTITPPVILQAHSIVVLAGGAVKAAVLTEALRMPDNIDALPARLALRGTWLLDTPVNDLNMPITNDLRLKADPG